MIIDIFVTNNFSRDERGGASFPKPKLTHPCIHGWNEINSLYMRAQLPTSHVNANERTNERTEDGRRNEKNVCLIQRSRVDKRRTDSDVFSFVSFRFNFNPLHTD